MGYWVYILRSEKRAQYYIGQTNNWEERLRRHKNGYVKSTKGRGPWVLVHKTELPTRSDAIILERRLKGFKSRKKLEAWMASRN